MLHIKW